MHCHAGGPCTHTQVDLRAPRERRAAVRLNGQASRARHVLPPRSSGRMATAAGIGRAHGPAGRSWDQCDEGVLDARAAPTASLGLRTYALDE